MDFYTLLDQVVALLRQRQRVSYRALKRQFQLDDDYLEDLKTSSSRPNSGPGTKTEPYSFGPGGEIRRQPAGPSPRCSQPRLRRAPVQPQSFRPRPLTPRLSPLRIPKPNAASSP